MVEEVKAAVYPESALEELGCRLAGRVDGVDA